MTDVQTFTRQLKTEDWGKVIFKVRNCSLCVFFMVYEELDAA